MVLGTWYLVLGTWYLVLGTWYLVRLAPYRLAAYSMYAAHLRAQGKAHLAVPVAVRDVASMPQWYLGKYSVKKQCSAVQCIIITFLYLGLTCQAPDSALCHVLVGHGMIPHVRNSCEITFVFSVNAFFWKALFLR